MDMVKKMGLVVMVVLLCICSAVSRADEELDALIEAAEQGDAWSQNSLGVAYAQGKGVEKSDGVAIEWFRKAA